MKFDQIEELKNSRWFNRTGIGLLFTGLYIAALVTLIFKRGGEVADLRLNELGDVAAGAFGPLAMVWLVLGYLQQGDELKQNTEALRLQAQELANAVQQQQQLVEQGRLQIEAEKSKVEEERLRLMKAARPKFEFTIPGDVKEDENTISLAIEVRNVGAPCSHIRVHTKYHSLWVSVRTKRESVQSWSVIASAPASEAFEVFDFNIHYLDASGNTGHQLVSVNSYADEDAFGYHVFGEDDQRVWNHRVDADS